MKKKILILLPYIPYPLNNGGNNAVFYMVDYLRNKHDISIGLDVRRHGIKAAPNPQKMEQVDCLKQLWPNVTFYLYEGQEEYPEEAFKQSLYCKIIKYIRMSFARKYKRSYIKWSGKHKEGDPIRAKSQLSSILPQYNPGYLNFINDITRKGFDIIQAEMYELLFLGYLFPQNVKKIFIHHELRFIRVQNEMSLFKKISPYDIIAYEEAKALELSALQQYDRIVTLTQKDKDILSGYIPGEKITVSPANVVHPENGLPFKTCHDFVFIGNGSHYPNQDALVWFTHEILPLIRQKHLSAHVYIVGNWPKKTQESLSRHNPEIRFVGFIDNLPEFLSGKISLIPLRIGSGMRIKILDAIKAHSPFITTSKGVEGLPFRNGQECIIADQIHDFAQAMDELLRSPLMQQRLSEQAQKVFKEYYDPEKLCQKRNDIYI